LRTELRKDHETLGAGGEDEVMIESDEREGARVVLAGDESGSEL
jgi:hypothetical protein